MKITRQHLDSGALNSIPSFKLVLWCLSRNENLPFLDTDCFRDLKKALNAMPQRFFHSIHTALTRVSEKDRNIHRKGENSAVMEKIERHADCVTEIIQKVIRRHAHLSEVAILQDPQVADYLKHSGLEEAILKGIRKEVDQLKKHHQLYGGLYSTFSRQVCLNF